MADSEPLIHCPLCGSIDILEQKGMAVTTITCDNPGETPKEVQLRIFVCGQCRRMFNELESESVLS